MNPKRYTRHIIKMTKITVAREKTIVTYKGKPIRLLDDFSTETFQARGNGRVYLKCWKEKENITKIQQSYHSEWKDRESFANKQKLKKLITTKPAL